MSDTIKYISLAVLILLLVGVLVFFLVLKKEPYYNPLNNSAFNVDSPNWHWQKVDEVPDNLCPAHPKYYKQELCE